MLLEKLRVVEGQLRVATYSQAAVPALRRVAEHLDAAVTEAVSKLREARQGCGLLQCSCGAVVVSLRHRVWQCMQALAPMTLCCLCSVQAVFMFYMVS